jgi:hypothetical protein
MSPLGLRTVPSALREQDEGLELLSAASRRRREASIVGKWLAMLREIAPRIARAALVADPKTPIYDLLSAGGRSHRTITRDRAGAQPRRDSRRH